ncbi:MAG: VWA domain-containing protein [Verrucomicrobia bacterium]|nr:VWA domain-containing protein [Verrucomicrobiota bacterium]MCH8510760.1 VWA domain-containing protein [Kiritimatiellia bacterium]
MKKNTGFILTALVAFFAFTLHLNAQEPAVLRAPVLVPGKTLPLRVLTRPFSSVRSEPSEEASLLRENVPAFQPFYVYTRPPVTDFGEQEGWYEVGDSSRGDIVGWMHAADVMEWHQAMCLAYTHPDGRDPVMMFARKAPLMELTAAPDRDGQVEALLETLASGEIPEDFPLVSVEPKRPVFMFIEEQFYLLPILNHEPIEMEGREGRLLRLAAATTAAGGRGSTTLQDEAFVKSAVTTSDTPSEKLKDLKVEVVYVIDTTASMQPYIDGTRAAIQRVAARIADNPDVAENVRFGLWAFRDSLDIPGIEYLTKNFTPELVAASDFAEILEQVEEAKVGSQGYPEDVFSGIDKALTETAWSPDSLKFIILIGDAPSHPKGHRWNASGKGAEELRQFANDARIFIQSVHIKEMRDPRVLPYHELTEQQFSKLAQNRGVSADGGSSYLAVAAHDEAAFAALSDAMLKVFESALESARQAGDLSSVTRAEHPDDLEVTLDVNRKTSEEAAREADAVTSQMVRAALVDWIGKVENVQAPRDITAWVVDKDLRDPAIPSLEVRVLVNKNQLDSLRTVLQELMVAGRRGQIANENFFDALQATSATLSVTPEQIRNARTIAETGLIPDFLVGLPYNSRIMAMSNDDWRAWSQDQQDEFLNDLDAKISYYGALHDEPGVWVRLNPGDDPDEHVHPLSLEMLP